jgi:anti-sigma factor RsiW
VNIDETADAYVMGRLSPADALQFANHCLTCHKCAPEEEEADSFVRDIKGAAKQSLAKFRVTGRKRLSRPSNTQPNPILPGAFSAQMRFYVTGYEPPRY